MLTDMVVFGVTALMIGGLVWELVVLEYRAGRKEQALKGGVAIVLLLLFGAWVILGHTGQGVQYGTR